MSYIEQKQEIETIQGRPFILNLSDADVIRLFEKAASVGLTGERLIESFIGDLVDGTYSNGSDERMHAQEWFDRCGFRYLNDYTFLRFLIDRGAVDEVIKLYNFVVQTKESIAQMEEELLSGEMKSRGKVYTWKDIVNSDNSPSYGSKEEWEASEREYIEQEQELLSDYEEQLNDEWEEYADYQKRYDREYGTFDEEIKKVLEYWEKLKKLLGDK